MGKLYWHTESFQIDYYYGLSLLLSISPKKDGCGGGWLMLNFPSHDLFWLCACCDWPLWALWLCLLWLVCVVGLQWITVFISHVYCMSMRGRDRINKYQPWRNFKEATNVRCRHKTFEQEKIDVVITFEGKTAGRNEVSRMGGGGWGVKFSWPSPIQMFIDDIKISLLL